MIFSSLGYGLCVMAFCKLAEAGACTDLPGFLCLICLSFCRTMTYFLSSILLVRQIISRENSARISLKKQVRFLLLLFLFPESNIFLIWKTAHSTIVVSHLLLVQRFAPVATGQKIPAMHLTCHALLMHTLSTWHQCIC